MDGTGTKHLRQRLCYNPPVMHLSRVEIQGFKTFAQKTVLAFSGPTGDRRPLTCVVGPNGSGKSNITDAIRWALGEQSVKVLRGKKSEDVIFSGSAGKGRSGIAEVSVTFNNEDHAMPIDFSEVVITRRLSRDGESEYLLNGSSARVSDIQLLLAQAGVGQRSYTVVGQGMVDHILLASPEERKQFFDDATGVRPLQIKRHEAMLKLRRTYENLTEAERLLAEIEPRLRSLKRQVSRLEQRETVEQELRALQHAYYSQLVWELADQRARIDREVETQQKAIAAAQQKQQELEQQLNVLEKSGVDDGLLALQQTYQTKRRERDALRDREFQIQREVELAKVRAQSSWAPLPLSKIIEEIRTVSSDHGELLAALKQAKILEDVHALLPRLSSLHERSQTLLSRLERPEPEQIKPDTTLLKELGERSATRALLEQELKDLEQKLEHTARQETTARQTFIERERALRGAQQAVHEAETRAHASQLERARLEEREVNLQRELHEAIKDTQEIAALRRERPAATADLTAVHADLQRLASKLELIGGIDPETVKEHQDVDARFTFLETQSHDLREALTSTERVLDELDEDIRTQSEQAFKEIQEKFQDYFRLLFGGGTCSLVKLTRDEVEDDAESNVSEVPADPVVESDALAQRLQEREDRVVGIDITATPPGKRLKALNLLSGGERALTSIALLSAIMAVHPSPFVVLDEVDAALDEANTLRFALILDDLSRFSQFIVITHNRATMEKADVLYGVTMADDGVSHLLSVRIEDIEKAGSTRR